MSAAQKTGLVALALGAAATMAFRRLDASWTAEPEVIPDGDRLLPVGESRRITTDDGAELAVTIAGPSAGEVVVLAHGWMNAREVWAPVAHRLVRQGRQVVLYDQRGHGSSTVGSDGFTIERLGGDLRCVLETLDLHGASLVGHSMGGMTIQSLATHHLGVLADRAAAIVLVSTAASGLSRNGRSDVSAAKMIGGRALERALRTRPGFAFFRSTVGRTVRKRDLVLTQQLFLSTTPEARSGCLTAMAAMDLRDGIAAIGTPTTILVGDRDRLTPSALADDLAVAIPGARLVTLRGFGHMLPLEAPELVADAVLEAAPIGQTARSLA